MAGRFPESIALRLDPSTTRSADGRSVLGGTPLRLLRFTAAGAEALDALFDPGRAATTSRTPAQSAVARRLVDAGMAHPRPVPSAASTTTGTVPWRVSVVVPVRDHDDDLARLLGATGRSSGIAATPAVGTTVVETIVVDDASAAAAVDRVVAASVTVDRPVTVRRHTLAAGPAGARNAGWTVATGDVVAFLDADVVPSPGWLDVLLPHFDDPQVGIVAPRVRSSIDTGATPGLLTRYEAARSPLDLGAREALVVPGGRVSYLPTAALVCRRSVLDDLGGFDETMRTGEDVDLVWRAVAAGWSVRYDPRAEVAHRPRASWSGFVRQRAAYGSAAAPLDARHPGAAAPVAANVWSLAAWVLAVFGGRRGRWAAAAVTAGATAALVPKLRGRLDRPARRAVVLAGGGTFHVGEWLARAWWRAWLPVAVVASAFSRRARWATVVAAVVPAVVDARSSRPAVDPVRWLGVRALDDAAYCVGVWRGAIRHRSARCLAPRLSGIPGVTD